MPDGQVVTKLVSSNVSYHNVAADGLSAEISPINVDGGIYPDIFVQPSNVCENIESAGVVIVLNKPSGIDVNPVHPVKVP